MARPKVKDHKTAETILQSAQHHFLINGFEGTPINDIANDANINKSLIYHHFGNKELLWKAVKERILQQALGSSLESFEYKKDNLKEFLEYFVTFRFRLYAQHPDLVRLMHWQRLESQSQSLGGVINKNFTTGVEDHISHLQKQGKIRSDLSADLICYFIMSTAANGFLDKPPFLSSKKSREEYLQFIIESLYAVLKSSHT
jgi:AcrR family transcriptional regulator